MFTVKMSEGVQAASYKAGDKFYIDPYKLLPMERFLGGDGGAAKFSYSIIAMPSGCSQLHSSYSSRVKWDDV